ncbi:DUF397 domain-containing protein [Nocardia sp. NBC_00511]|uniref:DUF397 domain-containing protein n=1 Tax=Nocardia sp. NBC_00511 TaxID=2903591 RepID=UPI0030E34259
MSTAQFHGNSRTGWFKSSKSNDGPNCVEVKFAGDVVAIRDSKFRRDAANVGRSQPVIEIGRVDWNAFLDLAVDAEVGSLQGLPVISRHDSGEVSVSAPSGGVVLVFTDTEWLAFTEGIRENEFAAA